MDFFKTPRAAAIFHHMNGVSDSGRVVWHACQLLGACDVPCFGRFGRFGHFGRFGRFGRLARIPRG